MMNRLTLSISALLLASSSMAQNISVEESTERPFGLFEAVDRPSTQSPAARRQAETQNRRPPTSPDFILQGTSRIGNRRNAILQHSTGVNVLVKVDGNSSVPIPGYKDYRIIGLESGRVNIQLPEEKDCVEFTGLGVGCSEEGDIAQLSLVNAAPVIRTTSTPDTEAPDAAANESGSDAPPVAPTTSTESSAEDSNTAEAPASDQPRNPFASLRSAAAAQSSATDEASANRFTPRRIDPNDIPPGKRVVSTPFGDRLVDI